jgi:hypothetical protein
MAAPLNRLAAGLALALLWEGGPALADTVSLTAASARPAEVLLGSMGVVTHFGFYGTPYTDRYAEVRSKLIALGIHRVRDMNNERITDLADHGITTTLIADPKQDGPEAVRDQVKRLNRTQRAIDAVEGPNEPDGFWSMLHISYQGKGYPDGSVQYQKDLYHLLKADPETSSLPVIGTALGLAGIPTAEPVRAMFGLWQYADLGNFHPYPFGGNDAGPPGAYGGLHAFYRAGTFPSVNLVVAQGAYRAVSPIYGNRPMAATETGYPTDIHHTAEGLQAKYIPRVYAEYFRLGIKPIFVYQFLDHQYDPKNQDPESAFGLLRYDLSERPSYVALQDFIHTLNPPESESCAPPPPDLRLTLNIFGSGAFDDTSHVHHLLLRRADGALLLLLWDEVSGDDASTDPHTPIAVPALPATLRTNRTVRAAIHTIGGAEGRFSVSDTFRVGVTDAITFVTFCSPQAMEVTATPQP